MSLLLRLLASLAAATALCAQPSPAPPPVPSLNPALPTLFIAGADFNAARVIEGLHALPEHPLAAVDCPPHTCVAFVAASSTLSPCPGSCPFPWC